MQRSSTRASGSSSGIEVGRQESEGSPALGACKNRARPMVENSPMQRPDSTNPAQRENVATLRAHWDPVADTFPKHLRCEGLCARMYRAFSWLERVEQLDGREGKDSADDQLVFSWTALNSLYGR